MGLSNQELKGLNKRINQLAEELVACSPAEINTHYVKKLQENIVELAYKTFYSSPERYDRFGNCERHYALVNQYTQDDVFTDALVDLVSLRNGQWFFNPAKGSFITALRFYLPKRSVNMDKSEYRTISLGGALVGSLDEDMSDMKGERATRKKEPEHPASESQFEAILSDMCEFGKLLSEFEQFDQHIQERFDAKGNTAQKKKAFYKGFFTFDTTKAIKSDNDIGEEACEHNDQLFPLLVISLLEFLMLGCFSKVHDILVNPLRNGIDLDQSRPLLSEYFEVSLPNITEHSKQYGLLIKACVNRESWRLPKK